MELTNGTRGLMEAAFAADPLCWAGDEEAA